LGSLAGRTGPYAKGEERRNIIVETAATVFATEGFEKAALKRATLFHYSDSKQELLQAGAG
jgi:AcrR family transcriptional regulator